MEPFESPEGNPSSPHTLLELPIDTLLCMLRHVDVLTVLRLSLCSHAAAHRLGGVAGLWEGLARRALLPPPSPAPPARAAPGRQAGSSGGDKGDGWDRDRGDGAGEAAGGGPGGPCTRSSVNGTTTPAAAVEAAGAQDPPRGAPRVNGVGAAALVADAKAAGLLNHSSGGSADNTSINSGSIGSGSSGSSSGCSGTRLSGNGNGGNQLWEALKAHARFAFWHSRHCLRLSRALGSPPAPQPLDGAWRAPSPRASCCCVAGRLAEATRGEVAAGTAGVDPDLFRLSTSELYGLRVCDGSDICVADVAVRCFSVLTTPSGAPCQLMVVAAWRGRPLAWLYFAAQPARPSWQDQARLWPVQGQGPPHHQQQQQQGQGQGVGQRPDTAQARQGLDAGGSNAARAAAAGPGPLSGAALSCAGTAPAAGRIHAAEAWVCRGAARAEGLGEVRTLADFAAELAVRVRLLAAAGLERHRCVAAVTVASRRRLTEAGVAAELAALRAAGVAVVDFAGILPARGAAANATAGGGGDGVVDVLQQDERERHPAGELAREVWHEVAAYVGSGGAESKLSYMSDHLRAAVERLPRTAPHVGVLLLPVIMPRGGRAGIRTTPSRSGGGAKCMAPRLLQLMVPVLSELRLAMSTRFAPGGVVIAARLPALQRVVLVMEEADEGPQAAALRNLAVSTLDRGTGMT